jgi:thiol-disulfide isomerase/thioredoxin
MGTSFALTVWVAGVLALPLLAQDPKPQDKPVDKPPVEAPKTPPTESLKLGSVVPETVSMTDLDGKTVSFKELRGKVVVIHFWSDRCPAEVHADPITKRLEKTYEGKDVVLLGINANQNELGAPPAKDADYSKLYTNLRKKIAEVGFKHRILADHGNRLSAMFNAKTTPHCFVIDAKGVLSYAGALDDDPQETKGDKAVVYVKEAADALLAGKEVAIKETRSYG